VSPADSEPQPDEVGLHLGDSLAAADRFTALGPLPHRIFCQRDSQHACQASFVGRFRHR
jgi:hypothetical protein